MDLYVNAASLVRTIVVYQQLVLQTLLHIKKPIIGGKNCISTSQHESRAHLYCVQDMPLPIANEQLGVIKGAEWPVCAKKGETGATCN